MIPRLLRSPRFLIAAGAVLIFGLLVLLAHHVGGVTGTAQPTVRTTATAVLPTSSEPAQVGPVEPSDEGVPGDPGPSPARITAGEEDPKEFAITFFSKYLNVQGKRADEWRASWHDLVTPELAEQLADVDTSAVPPGRIHDSQVRVIAEGDALVTVVIPIQGEGEATLTMTGGSRRWLVSQLDWAKIR